MVATDKGFTLIEVLVAMVVFSLALLGLGRPNRFLVVDRFLDSRCQSRLSYAWWRSPFNEKRFIQTQEMRTAEFFITI